jgi:DNA-binding HxlR family transcriptional regulator
MITYKDKNLAESFDKLSEKGKKIVINKLMKKLEEDYDKLPKHPLQQQRLNRMEKVYEFINENQPVSFEKISISFNFVARRTLQEYVKQLKDWGRITVNEVSKFVTIK